MFYTSTDFLRVTNLHGGECSFAMSSVSRPPPFSILSCRCGVFFFSCSYSSACGILVSWLRIKPVPLGLEARSLNYWATSEVPRGTDFISSVFQNREEVLELHLAWSHTFLSSVTFSFECGLFANTEKLCIKIGIGSGHLDFHSRNWSVPNVIFCSL